jgi:beta-N-acetylhexosaminidase
LRQGARERGAVAARMAGNELAGRTGGLLMFGFEGTTAAEIPLDLAANAAGVILFRRNIESTSQLRALTNAIRSAGAASGLEPLVALDQEGGPVSRLAAIGTTTPSAMALGAVRDPAATESMYRLIGTELRALGVNVNLAPVADVNNNPANPVIGIRSFGDDPHAVGLNVRAAIRGLHAASIAATAKHFPGHGDTNVDSHFDLPVIAHDLLRVRAVELVPFAAAIRENVDLIMSAHIIFGAIEADTPATLSRRVLTDLLRNELGFQGVIMTDCMEMQAIDARRTPEQAAVAAVAAGADLVLFSHTPDKVRRARAALEAALADGTLSADRVRESLERIAALRRRLARAAQPPPLEVVGSDVHQRAALSVARRAVTVVRDPKGMIPLSLTKGERLLVVEFAGAAHAVVEDEERRRRTAIGPALAATPARLHEQVRSLDPAGHEYKQLLMASGGAAAVIALTFRASRHPLQAQAISDLAMLGKRMVAVAGKEPYDARVFPKELAVVASYGEDPNAMQAAADVILGVTQATGKLPLRLDEQAEAVG